MRSIGTRIAVLSAAHGHAAGYCLHLKRAGVGVVLADPSGVSGPDGLRGRELADQLGVAYVDDYVDALADRCDGAVVCSENTRHRRLVELALTEGIPVLCEKPLATNVEDALSMCAFAERFGTTLAVAQPVRQAPSYRRLAELVGAGSLGRILSVVGTNNGMLPRDRSWFVQRPLSGGGAIVDHLVHCADLVDGLLGVVPTEVRAVANRTLAQDPPTEVETGALVTARYPSGEVATFDCSWSQPDGAPTWGGLTLDVIGTRGRVRIDPFAQHVAGYAAGMPQWLGFGTDLDALMINEFVECVRGERPMAVTATSALRVVRLLEAAVESAARGGEVVDITVTDH